MRLHIHCVTRAAYTVAFVALTSGLAAQAAGPHPAAIHPTYGGTVHVAFSGDATTFDPTQSFNEDWWLINGTLFNGLYKLDRHALPQLDLAAGPPTLSKDGTVWTFHLRKGVLFHNGMEMTANDVRFSITRALDPHLKPAPSWGQTQDAVFQGSQAFIQGKATSVSGIQVVDRYTIRFVLTEPVAVFPFILAQSYNMIVPQAVVSKESESDFASHPIGTGPYVLQSFTKDAQATFTRNPHYFRSGKPYINKIIADFSVPSSVIALKIQKGEVDGYGNDEDIGAADLQQVRSDPKYAHYLVPTAPTVYHTLNLNVHVPPLNNLMVRQAIAMAIDRHRLVKLAGGQSIPAYQLYIPMDPQHDPVLDAHPIYPYDPTKAAALVKASGYHGQDITLLYNTGNPLDANVAPGIQQDLKLIGLNVGLRGASGGTVHALQQTLTGAQLSLEGWSADFPDAYDYYSGSMSCGANAAGGSGASHYCDPAADQLVNQAERLPLGAARNALLRQAQVRILRSASRIPLDYPKSTEIVSPRVQGFYYQPLYGWTYEDYWLAH